LIPRRRFEMRRDGDGECLSKNRAPANVRQERIKYSK